MDPSENYKHMHEPQDFTSNIQNGSESRGFLRAEGSSDAAIRYQTTPSEDSLQGSEGSVVDMFSTFAGFVQRADGLLQRYSNEENLAVETATALAEFPRDPIVYPRQAGCESRRVASTAIGTTLERPQHEQENTSDLSGSVPYSNRICRCKTSKCLKLYCYCFQNSSFCTKNCKCHDCKNTKASESVRRQAISEIVRRRPDAFEPRVRNIGCSCKTNRCIRKYCACFTDGVACTNACRCRECENPGGRRVEAEYTSTYAIADLFSPVRSRPSDDH